MAGLASILIAVASVGCSRAAPEQAAQSVAPPDQAKMETAEPDFAEPEQTPAEPEAMAFEPVEPEAMRLPPPEPEAMRLPPTETMRLPPTQPMRLPPTEPMRSPPTEPEAMESSPPETAEVELAPSYADEGDVAAFAADSPYEIVPVFYGTDRQVNPGLRTTGTLREAEQIRDYYGSTDEKPSSLKLGVCRVSVPKRPDGEERLPGTIQRPGLFESASQADHFMLAELEPLYLEEFRTQLQAAIDRFPEKKQAFIYIHGFNNSFEEAAYRAAQMHVDLSIECVPTMYTWPSRGSGAMYKKDSQQIERSIPHIQEFLRIVARDTDADMIHLIAHSMGTKLLTTALANLPDGTAGSLPHINQIILAAPDIDAQRFVSEIAPRIERFGKRITIYQSNRDQALYLSQFTMNDPQIPRLGLRPVDLSGAIEQESKFNQIDATWVADSDIGHTYFGNTSKVINDVRLVLNGEDVQQRGMLPSFLMRGEVAPWQQPPTPWYIAWWKLLLGIAIGAIGGSLIRSHRPRKSARKN